VQYEDYLLTKDPHELSETVRKAMAPTRVGPLGFIVISNPVMPKGTALAWCGPEPEQQVLVTGLADNTGDAQ
jgi:hypothetical protein